VSLGATTTREECNECDRETPHEATIEMRTEKANGENVGASRQPYRVTECQICGETTTRRRDLTDT